MDPLLLARARQPTLRVGYAILAAQVASLPGGYALVTQPAVLGQLEPSIPERAAVTLIAGSLEEQELEAAAAQLPAVSAVVGIGGGVSMDTAKYLAWKRGLPLVLAPSIVSVDACVTNTIALRRGGHVVYEGFVVAEPIVVDLDLIVKAPPRLNRAGIGDILSIHTGRYDWALGAKAGTIGFDQAIDRAAEDVLERVYGLADDVAAVTERAIEAIVRAYAEVNALLLEVGHSGPEEGSEHYFAYAVEAATGRSFVHGELVGLGVVLMATLQGNEPERAAAFLDHCQVAWHPEDVGLERATLVHVLEDLPRFVRSAGLPHSIIDEVELDAREADRLLSAVPGITSPASRVGTGGRFP